MSWERGRVCWSGGGGGGGDCCCRASASGDDDDDDDDDDDGVAMIMSVECLRCQMMMNSMSGPMRLK